MNVARIRFLINKILNSPDLPEEDLNPYIDELLRLSPDPNIIDYMFWDDLTVDEIIKRVRNYKPIIL